VRLREDTRDDTREDMRSDRRRDKRLLDDNRALAFGIIDIMLLGLGTFALLYGLLYLPAEQLFSLGAGRVSGDAATGLGYARSAWLFLPFFALVAAVFALVARAVAERRGI